MAPKTANLWINSFSAKDPKNGKRADKIGKRRQWARQTPEKPIAALSKCVEFTFIMLQTLLCYQITPDSEARAQRQGQLMFLRYGTHGQVKLEHRNNFQIAGTS